MVQTRTQWKAVAEMREILQARGNPYLCQFASVFIFFHYDGWPSLWREVTVVQAATIVPQMFAERTNLFHSVYPVVLQRW